ncbi:MAG: peptidylprolyl isomerase [Acidimicrobiales bacterium]
MPSQKRERQKQGRQARQQQLLAQQRKAQTRRRAITAGAIALVVVVVALIFSRGGDGDGTTDVAAGSTSSTTPGASATAPGEPSTTSPVAGDPSACPPGDGSAPKTTAFPTPPATCIDPARSYTATVETDVGSFTIALAADKAPVTVNNFVFLARYHYYDDVAFHRVIPGFVVQGGDGEKGDGTGGPGYSIADELPKAGDYKVGSVAMANSGPNTNGSQFFVVTGAQGAALPPSYSLFGTVDANGLAVVKNIEADGTDGGQPKVTHKIVNITIKEK